MKTADLEPGQHGKPKLTTEEFLAGKTPNSGKLKKDGTPVPGQTPEADAKRAAERAMEAAEVPEPPEVPEVPAPVPPPIKAAIKIKMPADGATTGPFTNNSKT